MVLLPPHERLILIPGSPGRKPGPVRGPSPETPARDPLRRLPFPTVLDSPFAVIALVLLLVLVVSVLIGRREESSRRGAALSRVAKARRAKRIAARS